MCVCLPIYDRGVSEGLPSSGVGGVAEGGGCVWDKGAGDAGRRSDEDGTDARRSPKEDERRNNTSTQQTRGLWWGLPLSASFCLPSCLSAGLSGGLCVFLSVWLFVYLLTSLQFFPIHQIFFFSQCFHVSVSLSISSIHSVIIPFQAFFLLPLITDGSYLVRA